MMRNSWNYFVMMDRLHEEHKRKMLEIDRAQRRREALCVMVIVLAALIEALLLAFCYA
jgi:hypothetical protein